VDFTVDGFQSLHDLHGPTMHAYVKLNNVQWSCSDLKVENLTRSCTLDLLSPILDFTGRELPNSPVSETHGAPACQMAGNREMAWVLTLTVF